MLDEGELTPFQQDVHALGLVAWHLLSGKRMSPKSLETVQDSMLNSQHWYSDVLLMPLLQNLLPRLNSLMP
jgi:hypothetical protein